MSAPITGVDSGCRKCVLLASPWVIKIQGQCSVGGLDDKVSRSWWSV